MRGSFREDMDTAPIRDDGGERSFPSHQTPDLASQLAEGAHILDRRELPYTSRKGLTERKREEVPWDSDVQTEMGQRDHDMVVADFNKDGDIDNPFPSIRRCR